MMSKAASPIAPQGVFLRDAAADRWLHFARPTEIRTARRLGEVVPVLRSVAQDVEARGLHAAGFVSFEAAPGLDPALPARSVGDFPLLWFGLYEMPQVVRHLPSPEAALPPPEAWRTSVTSAEYRSGFDRIREFIARGHTYQVNFTHRLWSTIRSNPWDIFLSLAAAQGSCYGAYVDLGDWVICSASPELFFRLEADRIESRPMKGTARRGLWYAEDCCRQRDLRTSEKDRAENVMIVDMVRNDLGRIAEVGTVKVLSLFDVERYPTVWQMVSSVSARTIAPLGEILGALFPAASIVGAPKPRTMELIAELESTPRRIYTGAIGFIAPGRRAQFNVAIRTLLLNRRTDLAEYGVGGGLVWDSTSASEEEECRIKARVLSTVRSRFRLLETVLWTPEHGYRLLRRHLRRMSESGRYFGFPVDPADILRRLRRIAIDLPRSPHRIRLLVGRTGAVSVETSPITLAANTDNVVALADAAVDSSDVFLYHKTTNRRTYEEALRKRRGFADVILFNERGEVTESTIANIAAVVRGKLITPPIDCGLLPGTERAELLRRGTVTEGLIRVGELVESPHVCLFNSVKGIWRITLATGAKVSARE